MSQFLAAALEAARAADVIVRAHYRKGFEVRIKADATPVTEVDEAAEAAVKAVLTQAFPDHGFYGEEGGKHNAEAEYLWLVDPIDGTKAYVRGYPMFSTQIALMHRGELVLGVSSAPCFLGDGSSGVGVGETYYAVKDQGAYQLTAEGPVRLRVSDVVSVSQATLSLGNLARLAASTSWARLGTLIPMLHRIRGYADFLHYHLLASGRIDAVVETNVNILDIAALVVIVREAGGSFTQLDGGAITLDTTSVLASNSVLHDAFQEAINYH
ncbi:MAG: inositol monophosphatase family protein [Pseudomonadota bacterium]